MLSKVYSVKSNAARAAATHGLTRQDLEPVSGGWRFTIPETAPEPRTEASEAPATEVATTLETLTTEAPSVVSEPIEWAGKRLLFVNGSSEPNPEDEWQDFPPAAAPEPGPVEPEVEPEPTKPKRSREPVPEGQRKHRRDDPNAKPAPKSGKTAELIAALRADWQSVATMLDMTGWQRHTLRGYISRVAKHAGWILQRQDGESWQSNMYRIRVK